MFISGPRSQYQTLQEKSNHVQSRHGFKGIRKRRSPPLPGRSPRSSGEICWIGNSSGNCAIFRRDTQCALQDHEDALHVFAYVRERRARRACPGAELKRDRQQGLAGPSPDSKLADSRKEHSGIGLGCTGFPIARRARPVGDCQAA